MLEPLNYFKQIICPFENQYKSGKTKCGRPYCQFKHIKEVPIETMNLNDIQIELPKNLKNIDTTSVQITDEFKKAIPQHLENAFKTVSQLFNTTDPNFANLIQTKFNEILSGSSITHKSPTSTSSKKMPEYTPTPIKELNKMKLNKSQILDESELDVDMIEDTSDIKRKFDDESNESNSKKYRTDDEENSNISTISKSEEIKKLMAQKAESVLRKMSNPMAFTMSNTSMKINKSSLNQQLMKRYEIINAERAKNNVPPIPLTKEVSKVTPSQKSQIKTPTTSTSATSTSIAPVPKLILDNTARIPVAIRQRYLKVFFDETKNTYQNLSEACDKAAEHEKSIYDRSKTKNIYTSLAAHLMATLKKQNATSLTTTQMNKTKLTNNNKMTIINNRNKPAEPEPNKKISYSHEAMLGGPKANKISYSINRKKKLSLKEISPSAFYDAFKVYLLTEKQLEENGYPSEYPLNKELAYIPVKSQTTTKYSLTSSNVQLVKPKSETKTCKRCLKYFIITKTMEYLSKDDCVHHWGKLRTVRVNKVTEQKYSCCSQDSKSEGCAVSKHVYEGDEYDSNEPLTGYIKTKPPLSSTIEASMTKSNIFALDCEMCYTTKGLELTRVSVIDADLKLIYDTIVLPDHEIIDYNTRWSGLTIDDFKNCTTKLRNVQSHLLKLFNKNTILIGHSLESDFKALKLIHKTVIDTSVVFPHHIGPPMKRALRNLTSEYLKKFIQEDVKGHDPTEDARACMELMIWKVDQNL